MEKLNIREFRIGNLVDRTDYICRVVGIESLGKEALILDPINYTTERFVVQDIKPIPLTEEWLLKFGWFWNEETNSFEKMGTIWHVSKSFHIDIQNWQVFNYVLKAVANKEIKYVHQLQNLYFALTGEELTIKS